MTTDVEMDECKYEDATTRVIYEGGTGSEM